jgi:hypothetical protein
MNKNGHKKRRDNLSVITSFYAVLACGGFTPLGKGTAAFLTFYLHLRENRSRRQRQPLLAFIWISI